MPSIFLSHNSADKPFVEKLARDLMRLGIKVWFDNWEIKVGDSITWKIEEGIRENEYLGIVLSPDAIKSEWVKSELSAAWVKQMRLKKIVILPILYHDCDIPLLLADKKYADFRSDYQNGLKSLAGVFGISETEMISEDNWRRFVGRNPDWKKYRDLEFEKIVTRLVDMAIDYKWSSWIGGTQNPFSMTLSASVDSSKRQSISLKLKGRSYAYMASLNNVINPNSLNLKDFTIYIGNSINECEEFVWRHMEDFKAKYGDPTRRTFHYVEKFLGSAGRIKFANKMTSELKWYKGQRL